MRLHKAKAPPPPPSLLSPVLYLQPFIQFVRRPLLLCVGFLVVMGWLYWYGMRLPDKIFPDEDERLQDVQKLNGSESDEEEEEPIRKPSRTLIDFVEEEEKKKKKRGKPLGGDDSDTGGGDDDENPLVVTASSVPRRAIVPAPPCVTIKYLMGLSTTTVERDWLYYDMLSKIPCPMRVIATQDESDMTIPHDTDRLVIVKSYRWKNYGKLKKYIMDARAMGYKSIGLVHLSDEELTDKPTYEEYPLFDYVFRNYYAGFLFAGPRDTEEQRRQKQARTQHLYYYPLGYKNGYGPIPQETLLPASRRKYSVFFMGQPRRSEFNSLVGYLPKILQRYQRPFEVTTTAGWAKGLSFDDYRQKMMQTSIALVPGGVNPDTYRFSEAFEAGTIPVIENSMANPILYGEDLPFPGPVVSSWSKTGDAIPTIERLLSNVTLMNAVQARCMNWWRAYKDKLSYQWRAAVMTDYS